MIINHRLKVLFFCFLGVSILFFYFSFSINTSANPFLRPKSVSVPNLVHFVNLDVIHLPFVSIICILAAFFNQSPDTLFIHTNVDITQSKYWNILNSTIGDNLKIQRIKKPSHVYGIPISSPFHASDIARLKILQKYGGITLDQDLYIVKNLSEFLSYEFSLGWDNDSFLGSQILIANKNARFIKLWLKSYKDYRPSMWYYNAGEHPTKDILEKNPDLVHRVKEKFGVRGLSKELYTEYWPEWKTYYTIHLLWRHRNYLAKQDVKETGIDFFDEFNIKNYNKTFGEMARIVWKKAVKL